MPVARSKKRKTQAEVPDLGDPDRKRVLNVLAQRRYRQRQREKVAALQDLAQGLVSPQSSCSGDDSVAEEEPQIIPEMEFSQPAALAEQTAWTSTGSLVLSCDFSDDPFNAQLVREMNSFDSMPTPICTPPSSVHSPDNFAFPLTADASMFEIPILHALNAFTKIAIALDVATNIWDPSYLHVLSLDNPALASLPENLHPIPSQYTVPHHPVLDILPWPSVRDKLICVLSLPSALRPPVAREESFSSGQSTPGPSSSAMDQSSSSSKSAITQSGAIIRLVQDLDDLHEGVRVHGNMTAWSDGNELIEESWEVGEVFYGKWWWCLDRKIVDRSNRRRLERGARRLRLEA